MQHLDIFKVTFEYAGLVVDLLEGMPKKYRFSIGETMLKSALEMFRQISHANRTRGEARRGHLDLFLAEHDNSAALVRLCNERRVLTVKQVARLSLLIDSMGRQAKGWQKA